jgi:thiosulfate/3-mercaptopyruvate sulfurtransferase
MNEASLVSSQWLAAHLDDPTVVVAHVQYESDIDDYSEGHIPGARKLYWKDFFWHDTIREFPTPAEMAARLGSLGVDENTTLVFYSGRNQYAIYGYWVTKILCGHPDVRVLNGHMKKWTLEGRELQIDTPTANPRVCLTQREARDDSSRIGSAELREKLGEPGHVVLDGRYHSEYNGERVKPGTGFDFGAERWGRIPGAKHLFFRDLFDDKDDTLLPPDGLEAMYRGVGAAPDQADAVVSYCRCGHRASLLWFAATQLLGWDHIRVYDGSWTEWGSSVGFPIERQASI